MMSKKLESPLKWYLHSIIFLQKPYDSKLISWGEWSVDISKEAFDVISRFHDFTELRADGTNALKARLYSILHLDYYYKSGRNSTTAEASKWADTLSLRIMEGLQTHMRLDSNLIR